MSRCKVCKAKGSHSKRTCAMVLDAVAFVIGEMSRPTKAELRRRAAERRIRLERARTRRVQPERETH